MFSNYWNFNGTSLPSGWQELTSGGDTYTVNNGITFNNAVYSDYVSVGTTSAVAHPGIFEADITNGGNARPTIELSTTDTQIKGSQPIYMYENGYGMSYGMYSGDMQFAILTSSFSFSSNTKTAYNSPLVVGVAWPATGTQLLETYQPSYTNLQTVSESDTSTSIASDLYIMFGQAASGNSGDTGGFTASWLRTRIYPPSGVMPSVSFGSIP